MLADEVGGSSRHTPGPWREAPGEDLGRLLALSDGIFAFSMTLLVTNLLGIFPASGPNPPIDQVLSGNVSNFVIFATIFFIIGTYWMGHHRLFRYIERYDGALLWMNLALLFTIALTPFVLEVYNRYPGTEPAGLLFGGVSAITGSLLWLIWWHASRGHHLIAPDLEARVIAYYDRRGLVSPAIFLVSMGVAVLSPESASYVWLAIFPAMIWVSRYGA